MSTDKHRYDNQPAFVLHTYPYRETSLLVEIFSLKLGRLAVIARGARRPRSALRGLLLPFQLLHLGWSGKSELRVLQRAEWQGSLPQLQGKALLCGFYLNELLVKLLPREDAHEALFEAYQQALNALNQAQNPATTLRRFEKLLLKELGYALVLDREIDTGAPIHARHRYTYAIERGPMLLMHDLEDEHTLELSGKTLLDMAVDDYSDQVTQQQSKSLMRVLINHYLGSQVLYTRQLLKELNQL